MEEFHPTVVHCAGEVNNSADALSRLPMKRKREDEIKWELRPERLRYSDYDDNGGSNNNNKPSAEEKIENQFIMFAKVMSEFDFELGDTDNLYPMATRSQAEFEDLYPLSLKRMREEQQADAELKKLISGATTSRERYQRYSYKKVEDVELIHDNGKILVPAAARNRVLDWYHEILVHPGMQRM